MTNGIFARYSADPENSDWDKLTQRQVELYSRADDVRTDFGRDYTRILHSFAFRRLKHKTQVFFNVGNDHICTRMEHVSHVESVSCTIAKSLGLNTELTKAISIGHDLGHAPFGHQGEVALDKLSQKHLIERFWHEKNGLRFIDKIELLEDPNKVYKNLNLTYAVRDGILSHCGEVDENGLYPRDEFIDLDVFVKSGEYQPKSWEGCVVKMSDKIAYIGRDIEDALLLKLINKNKLIEMKLMSGLKSSDKINVTVIMHDLIIDICKNSSPEKGICLSPERKERLDKFKAFNYENIYKNSRLEPYKHYSELIISEVFQALKNMYDGKHTIHNLYHHVEICPELFRSFAEWLERYCDVSITDEKFDAQSYENEKIYSDLSDEKTYIQAIIDYISGMTDGYIIKVFNELISF